MNIRHLISRTVMFEGFQAWAYLCTMDHWTVGYGSTHWHGQRVTPDWPVYKVEADEAMTVLKGRLLDSIDDCIGMYGKTWRVLTSPQQEVLVHMAYQLGRRGLRGFKRMNKAVHEGDTHGWLIEMQDSHWWDQTPRPAEALADCIRHGDWQGEWSMA